MYQTFLKELLADHPLFGIESDEKFAGNDAGLIPPAWVDEGPVYEVFLRAFSAQGTFNALHEKIPALKELGIKTIWLMPVHPVGKKARKGSLGSPYAVKNFSSIEPGYGSKKDLHRLIQTIHDHDMKIILDLVANHAARDHHLVGSQRTMFKKTAAGPNAGWTDVIEFDYENPETRSFMLEVMQYWVKEFDIDGYRCDVAGLIPCDFWKTAVDILFNMKQDLFMLAEWESAALHRQIFHATYDWSLYVLCNDVRDKKRAVRDIVTWVNEKEQFYPHRSLPLRFTENHDLPRTMANFGRDSFYPFAALMYVIYGIPLIYAGQEIGAVEKLSLFEQGTVDWQTKNTQIYDFYRRLIKIRRQFPALRSRDLIMADPDMPDGVLVFRKYAPHESILVILNFSADLCTINIDMNGELSTYSDLMSEAKYISSANLKIRPHAVHILKKQSASRKRKV